MEQSESDAVRSDQQQETEKTSDWESQMDEFFI